MRPATPLIPALTPNDTIASSSPAGVAPEERRLVSALFCDLVGFTPLSERLDPEEVREIQAAYFAAMAAQVARYGGIVEKYAGDAVLALFGVPAAHEDDAERAVLCALAMQGAIGEIADGIRRQYDVESSIRVGVNTGEVVSGSWDASGRQQEAVTGDVVNTAARLQAAAEPGSVLVGSETRRLSRRRIRYGDERLLTLKGKSEPVPAYPALSIREEIEERWETMPRATPLLGREQELGRLTAAWGRVVEGDGQLVTVVGEAGVGKSRLLAEAIERIRRAAPEVLVLRGRSLSYGQGISLWLIAELLRGVARLRDDAGIDVVQDRLTGTLERLLGDCDLEDRREAIDVLGEVLGLPAGGSMVAHAGPQIRRAALIRGLRRVLGALSSRSTVVLALEDLHWIDRASQETIQELLSTIPGTRVLVVVAHRPEWSAPWTEWGWTEQISLQPLAEKDAALLAEAVLGGMVVSAEVRGYLDARAGGNPFFVEELIRALDEAGGLEERSGSVSLRAGAAQTLPTTLTEVILARLDRLGAQVKGVAQVGSVIGRSFAVRLLARVMERSQAALELPLTALHQAELVFPRKSAELEYVFKHATIEEVAYGMLLRKRRRDLHLQVARAITALYPPEEYVELIAYHYGKTDEPEAVEWLERAGDRAASSFANDAAAGHYREAIRRLEAMGAETTSIAALEQKLGNVLYLAGRYDEALDPLTEAAARYRQAEDLEGAGRATAHIGLCHFSRGTPEEGMRLVAPALELLDPLGPSEALARLHLTLAHLLQRVGRYGDMCREAQRAGEIAGVIGDERLRARATERRGTALGMMGQIEEALHALEGAIPLSEAIGDLILRFNVLGNAGSASYFLGRMEEARWYFETALTVAERIGNPDAIATMRTHVGDVLITIGAWPEARDRLERDLATSRDRHTADAYVPLRQLAHLDLLQGRWQEARVGLEKAMALAGESGDRWGQETIQACLAELDVLEGRPEETIRRLATTAGREDANLALLPTLVWAHLYAGEVDLAAAMAADAIRRMRDAGERRALPDALRVHGMVLACREQWTEAESAFQEGLDAARSLPDPYAEARILHQLGHMHIARNQAERGRTRLQEARAIFRALGATKDVESVEMALAETAK